MLHPMPAFAYAYHAGTYAIAGIPTGRQKNLKPDVSLFKPERLMHVFTVFREPLRNGL